MLVLQHPSERLLAALGSLRLLPSDVLRDVHDRDSQKKSSSGFAPSRS